MPDNLKVPKQLVFYNEIPPPASPLYEYKCSTCAQFRSPKTCNVVQGYVKESAWCILWVPGQPLELRFLQM